MVEAENRDRELENLLGQFLVASFQSDKLAELIYEKMSFRSSPKEIRMFLSGTLGSRPPLLVTIRIEPYNPQPQNHEDKSKGSLKIVCVLESPPLEIPPARAKSDFENIVEGSFRWWSSQGQYEHLSLDEWKISTVALNSSDSKQVKEVYRILQALEAKRKGEIGGP